MTRRDMLKALTGFIVAVAGTAALPAESQASWVSEGVRNTGRGARRVGRAIGRDVRNTGRAVGRGARRVNRQIFGHPRPRRRRRRD